MPGPIADEVSESELSPKPGAARRPDTDTPSDRAFGLFRTGCAASGGDFDVADHITDPLDADRTLPQDAGDVGRQVDHGGRHADR